MSTSLNTNIRVEVDDDPTNDDVKDDPSNEDGHDELYDLSKDPYEQKDLASKNKKQAQKLNTKLLDWLKGVNAKYPVPDPEFNLELANKKYKNNVEVLMPKLEKERNNMLRKDYKPNENWWKSKITKD